MKFIIRFAQVHEAFRRAEIEAIGVNEGLDLKILDYDIQSPICVVDLPSTDHATVLARRSILAQSIHEFWAEGTTYNELHQNIKKETIDRWGAYEQTSFKFDIEPFQGTRSRNKRLEIFNSFKYLPLKGPIRMNDAETTFMIFENWPLNSVPLKLENPSKIYFGRFISLSARETVLKFDLKKRDYISTTSMDSELSLVSANIALAGPGKLFYDPFVGTGSFPIACAHFGATSWGSDIDGRSMRGDGKKKSLKGNFRQYGLGTLLGDTFAADLTHTPIRKSRIWDGIICDPPYGVREGLRVLGCRDPEKTPWLVDGRCQEHTKPGYVPPKKPYGFTTMLDDLLAFASDTLVEEGRLSFWMPTANDEEQELGIPEHPCLEIASVCVQAFYKWSRRLITYRRLPDSEVSGKALEAFALRKTIVNNGTTADDLNPFRKAYFEGFDRDK